MSPAKRRSDQLTELAAKFAPPSSANSEPPKPATRPTARTKPVRRTLDLSPARHHELLKRAQELAVVLGLPSLSGQVQLEELVALYLTDETVARRLEKRLRDRYEGQ